MHLDALRHCSKNGCNWPNAQTTSGEKGLMMTEMMDTTESPEIPAPVETLVGVSLA